MQPQAEMKMLTAGDLMQDFINQLNIDTQRNIKNRIERAQAILKAHKLLREAGVFCVKKELTKWDVYYGTLEMKVENIRDWGKIHKAIGKLEVFNKEAVVEEGAEKKRGKRKQLIKVYLSPVDKEFSGLTFSFVKQLTANDKCKVQVVKSSRVEVVCSVK